MSRGGLMLRCAASGEELRYIAVQGRRGAERKTAGKARKVRSPTEARGRITKPFGANPGYGS